ncbi:MAG TPA: response regulator [Deltaproteobacteria bacterium]|nr:response regulator [Deltaproteobacteria bacterium]
MTKKPSEYMTNPEYPDEPIPSNILVVDDSRVVRTYLQSHLQKQGYIVTLAKDGKEAVSLISNDIGIVLLDLWMPEMDGMACLRHIRENYPDIPVIIITVSHEISNAVDAMKYGAFDYVTKPFNPNEILALVQQAIKTRVQTERLRRVEAELDKAREHEIAIASRIQQTLLLGGKHEELKGIKLGDLTIASKKVDGDFYDVFMVHENCMDLIVGDVMGKGIPAALLGAAAKHHFMSVLYKLTRISGNTSLPRPEEIVLTVHDEMIGQMRELDTFFTLCYARFDLYRKLLSYVDCGHMRTIHFHSATNTCSLLQGVNMPLGFPGQDNFKEILIPFEDGDLFFFYSDGLTEAKDSKGDFFGEERLEAFIRNNAQLEPQELCSITWKNIVEFSQSETFSDDFTCVAVKIDLPETDEKVPQSRTLEVSNDLNELAKVRDFIQEQCDALADGVMDEERIKMVQIVSTEIMTNIINHSYKGKQGKKILIEAMSSDDEIVLYFYDWGIEFDFSTAPQPIFDGSKESGFGLHIIAHTADYVRYSRDSTGKNCACVTFFLKRRG